MVIYDAIKGKLTSVHVNRAFTKLLNQTHGLYLCPLLACWLSGLLPSRLPILMKLNSSVTDASDVEGNAPSINDPRPSAKPWNLIVESNVLRVCSHKADNPGKMSVLDPFLHEHRLLPILQPVLTSQYRFLYWDRLVQMNRFTCIHSKY